jgi:hypothetical protein
LLAQKWWAGGFGISGADWFLACEEDQVICWAAKPDLVIYIDTSTLVTAPRFRGITGMGKRFHHLFM